MLQSMYKLTLIMLSNPFHYSIIIYSIVGNADGGKMMSEKEFEEFKKNVRDARKNRLYVSWRNSSGQDCRTIGPASQCFCGHRYKEHNFDNVKDRKINCRAMKCPCKMFTYVPICNLLSFNFFSRVSRLEMPLQTFM